MTCGISRSGGFRLRFLSGVFFLWLSLLLVSAGYAAQRSLAWDPPENAGTSGLDGYRVFCRLEGRPFDYNRPAWQGDKTKTSCTISDLQEDATYYFVVRSVDVSGNMSEDSNEVPHMLTGLKIDGPGWVKENSKAYYTAKARFKIGSDLPVTKSAQWTIDSPFGSIRVEPNEDLGEWLMVLSTSGVLVKQKAAIQAKFTFAGETTVGTKNVWIVDGENREDNDGDGMPNWWESWYGLDPYVDDSQLDADGDGLSNLQEYQHGTDPTRADTDMDGYTDHWEIVHGFDPVDPESMPRLPFMEFDDIYVVHLWKSVEFKKSFSSPVVVAKPLSLRVDAPAVVRMRNVGPTGFDIRVQQWDYLDGFHGTEKVGYLVMEQGNYVLPDGTRVEAGIFQTAATNSLVDISFETEFNVTPIIVTSVSSYNEVDAVTCRVDGVNTRGFRFCMQEQESNNQDHAAEAVSYIAWEPSSGSVAGLVFEVGTARDRISSSPYDLYFGRAFKGVPTFIADMQTRRGGDTANLRLLGINESGARLFVDEERSLDEETYHVPETVGYMVFFQH